MYRPSLRSKKEIILSSDGTRTLYSKEFDEAYHSTKDGALHESLQKHVIPALSFKRSQTDLTILDICFGLGYNTFATLYYVKKNNLKTKLHILSPEFDEELIASLADFDYPPEFETIQEIIKKLSRNLYYEDDQFKIEILLGDAREKIPLIQERIDIVYQDAFSPRKNPLLWTQEYFADIATISHEDMLLTSYSTASSTRLGLYENGFSLFVHRGEGVRYSTIASKRMLEGLEYIDMELKKERNPTARSLRDCDFLNQEQYSSGFR